MLAMVEVPEHHMAVRGDERRPRRVVGDPDLHVRGVRRVTDVERIEQKSARVIPFAKFRHEPGEPGFAHALQIGRR